MVHMDQEALKLHEKNYQDIVALYDIAETFIDVVEHSNLDTPEYHLNAIEPLIGQIEKTADTLAEEYRKFILKGEKASYPAKSRLEKALRNAYIAMHTCQKKLNTPPNR